MSAYEYRAADLDPAMRTWLALAGDVYDDDREAGLEMLCGEVARVLVKARAEADS